MSTTKALELIGDERYRQETLKAAGRFLYTCADDEMNDLERLAVLTEEVGEVGHELNEGIGPGRAVNKRQLLKELIQVAAVATAWIERLTNDGVTP